MNARKILLVDDDESFSSILKLNLETEGYDALVENDPMKALLQARIYQPDVIILDVVMPGLDGGDVRAALKSDSKLNKVPVIMLTALVSPSEIGEGSVAQSGDDVMIGKPVQMALLKQCIEEQFAAVSSGPEA